MPISEPPAGLHDLRLTEAMSLWAELVEAYHGVNGFGGDTAELYAYRFGHYAPGHDVGFMAERYARRTAETLGALLDRFVDAYDVGILIDGVDYLRGTTPPAFDHRVHVMVVPRADRQPRGRRR